MVEGEVAPFSGQLLTTKLAIVLGQKAESFDIRLQLELSRVEEKYKLDIKYEQTRYETLKTSTDQQISLLTERLEKAVKRSWYEHPAFIVSCTLVAAVLIFVATAYLIEAVTESEKSVTYNYGESVPQ